MKKIIAIMTIIALLISSGCSSTKYPTDEPPTPMKTKEDMYLPTYPLTLEMTDNKTASIDYSNTSKGYIGVKKISTDDIPLKVAISKGDRVYYYDVTDTKYISYPLQMGNGSYQVRILKQNTGDNYAVMFSKDIEVTLESEEISFLYPSVIVNYTSDSQAVTKSFDLTKEDTTNLERIYHIYEYVVDNVKYDDQKAKEVEGKFVLPVIDETLVSKKGICFDYTALLTAMLRCQGIPTRLMTGYTSKEYHSWVEIWVENEGWINPQVYFKEKLWNRVDPTFAAQGQEYDGEYVERYTY